MLPPPGPFFSLKNIGQSPLGPLSQSPLRVQLEGSRKAQGGMLPLYLEVPLLAIKAKTPRWIRPGQHPASCCRPPTGWPTGLQRQTALATEGPFVAKRQHLAIFPHVNYSCLDERDFLSEKCRDRRTASLSGRDSPAQSR